MRIHRFLTNLSLNGSELTLRELELCRQMFKVLRLKPGEQVEMFNPAGEQAKCLITEIDEHRANLMILEKTVVETERRKIVLAAAIIKRDNFEWIVQKATETGVTEIIPLHTERSIKFGVQAERLKKICREAAEQCGRVSVPFVREPEEFKEVLKSYEGFEKYFFDAAGKQFTKTKTDSAILFVGPEGGWSEAEREKAREADCKIVSLGKNVLRSETAATIAGYLAVNG